MYGYDGPELGDVLFIRYEILNASAAALEDAYVGFHADVDLDGGRTASGRCGPDFSANNTGYSPAHALSYTYHVAYRGDRNDSGCAVPVFGITFLESPSGTAPGEVVDVHRIVRKNDYFDPDFGELGLDTPSQVLDALQGLSNTGAPMTAPTTGATTRYAFPGDPVRETGWLDVDAGVDVRSLVAAGPFSLAPRESTTLTVLLAAGHGDVLSEALADLAQRVGAVRGQRDLWRF